MNRASSKDNIASSFSARKIRRQRRREEQQRLDRQHLASSRNEAFQTSELDVMLFECVPRTSGLSSRSSFSMTSSNGSCSSNHSDDHHDCEDNEHCDHDEIDLLYEQMMRMPISSMRMNRHDGDDVDADVHDDHGDKNDDELFNLSFDTRSGSDSCTHHAVKTMNLMKTMISGKTKGTHGRRGARRSHVLATDSAAAAFAATFHLPMSKTTPCCKDNRRSSICTVATAMSSSSADSTESTESK